MGVIYGSKYPFKSLTRSNPSHPPPESQSDSLVSLWAPLSTLKSSISVTYVTIKATSSSFYPIQTSLQKDAKPGELTTDSFLVAYFIA